MTEIELPYFLARPVGGTPAPGVVVIHESTGIGTSMLRFCQRLAGEGYLVAAPDLFFRVGGTEAAEYAELSASLQREQVQADLTESTSRLREMGATSVGAIGFCLGGSLAYRMAVETTIFDGAISLYGVSLIRSLGTPSCPLLLMYGQRDPWLDAASLELVRAHHPEETIVYPDAGHGFMRDGSEEFVVDAAADAWERSLAFFTEHLVR